MSSEIPLVQQQLPEPSREPKPASEQLRDCSHLIALLADQVEALQQGDYPRVRELNAMRVRLAEEMQGDAEADIAVLEWIVQRMEAAVAQIEGWIETDHLTRDRLSLLRDESLPLVRGMRQGVGSGNYLSPGPGSAKVDVRL